MRVNTDELGRLPLRALVAYAARCARRVRALFWARIDHPERDEHERAIDRAIMLAEGFAATTVDVRVVDWADAVDDVLHARHAAADDTACWAASVAEHVVRATRDAATGAAPRATRYAFTAATLSAGAVRADKAGEADAEAAHAFTIAAARADFEILERLDLGQHPDLGRPVDPSESGPLGPFWPDGEPEW